MPAKIATVQQRQRQDTEGRNLKDWRTPPSLFAKLHAEFAFTLDAAADASNALCPDYFTEEDDALRQTWTGVVWCNPPYGHEVGEWVRKAHLEARSGATVVMLLPVRTDGSWWHDDVMRAEEVRLIRGRLAFGSPTGYGAMDMTNRSHTNATFASCIVIFRPGRHAARFTSMYR